MTIEKIGSNYSIPQSNGNPKNNAVNSKDFVSQLKDAYADQPSVGGSVKMEGGIITGADDDQISKSYKPGKSYNLLSDKCLSLRGMNKSNGIIDTFGGDFKPSGFQKTVLSIENPNNFGELSHISFNAEGVAYLDGQKMEEGVAYNLKDGGVAIYNNAPASEGELDFFGISSPIVASPPQLTIETAEGYNINQTAVNGNVDIEVQADSGDGVGSDGRMPTGLMGQTYDSDTQVFANDDVNIEDYEEDSLYYKGINSLPEEFEFIGAF